MNSLKRTVSLILILAVLASGLFLPEKAQAEKVKFGDVTWEFTKGLGALAMGDLAIKKACKGYAWTAENVDFGKAIGNFLTNLIGEDATSFLDKAGGKISEFLGIDEGGGALGSSIPTEDKNLPNQQKTTRATSREENCISFLRDVVLATFKKRMLDKMTDMTISWIKGEDTEPMFVTDPKGFYKQTVNEVTGQLIEETKFADLCYEPQRFRLEFLLETPKFSEQISCTLDQVIDNVTAFRDDFRNGNWLSYQEVLKPQNNRYGIETMVLGEKQRREYEASLTAQYELGSANGFLGQKRCEEWTATKNIMNAGAEGLEPMVVYQAGQKISAPEYYAKTPPDASDESKPYTGRVQKPVGSPWRCTNPQTVTPGQVASEALTKSIGSEYDFIINADDLRTYGAAIFDTLINQLIKKGVESGKGLFAVESHKESAQARAEAGETGCSQFEDSDLRLLCEQTRADEGNLDATRNDVYASAIGGARDDLEEAFSTLQQASSTLLAARQNNEDLIDELVDLANCQTNLNLSGNDAYDENAEDKYHEAVDRRDLFNDTRQSVNSLEFRITDLQESLDEVSIGDEEEIVNLSGDAGTVLEETETLSSQVTSLSNEVNSLVTGTNQNLQSLESDYPDEYPACTE